MQGAKTLFNLFRFSTPETFEIVANTIDIEARKNLGQVSKVLTQISSGMLFSAENKAYMPLNKYVEIASQLFSAWFLEGLNQQYLVLT